MAELQGAPGEIHFIIEIKRAATGETETVEMIGTPIEEDDGEAEEIECR